MSLNDEVRILRQVPLFSGVDPARLKRLAFDSTRIHFEAGEALFRQGDYGDSAYLLLNGRAEVLADSVKGPVRVAEIPERSIVGEMAVLCEGGRTATVRAMEPLDALRIGRDELMRMLGSDATMTLGMLRVVAARLRDTTDELIAERTGGPRSGG